MTSIPVYATAVPLTDAEAVQLLCQRLPERFRLTEPDTGEITGAGEARTFTYRNLEGDWGPGWSFVGVSLDSNHGEMQEYALEGSCFDHVFRYCHDEKIRLVQTFLPERPHFQQCAVTLDRGDSVLHLATGYSPSVAALRALAQALMAWGLVIRA